jgi:hypothetical protein
VDFLAAAGSTTNATSTYLSVTGSSTLATLQGAGLGACTGTSALTWSGGLFGCQAQPQGTVTAVSVASANGFAGTSGGGATPILTLTTTITGLLKGNGTAISAAALTDFPTQALNTFLANGTAASAAPTAISTSTIFGTVQSGKILAGFSDGTIKFAATSTNSCASGVTCSYSNGTNSFSIAANALALSQFPTLGAGQIWANNTAATGNAIAIATSSIFGTGQPGQHLAWLSGVPTWTATTTFSCSSGITCTFAGNQESYSIAGNALTLAMFPTIAANTVIGNLTGGTATPTAFATSSLFTGATGQFGYFSGSGALIGTSSIFASTKSFIGVSSTTPFSVLSIGTGLASSSVTVAEYKYGVTGNVATSTAMQADCNASTQLAIPIGFSATTITIVNMTPGKKCIVVVQNPGGTAGAVTWAISGGILKWAGGTTPTQTTTANSMDVWSFLGTAGSSTMQVIGAATVNN